MVIQSLPVNILLQLQSISKLVASELFPRLVGPIIRRPED